MNVHHSLIELFQSLRTDGETEDYSPCHDWTVSLSTEKKSDKWRAGLSRAHVSTTCQMLSGTQP